MQRFLCIHGHFYQPPRENPWLELVERQASAHPFHDWNDRISEECYAANAHARILDEDGYIRKIVSNYSRMSFNFGPTLLSWLEVRRPALYRSIIQSDVVSRGRFSGHGSAIAQIYNHVIMPLASERDKNTQVRWGLYDFERRFGRAPEGMWLSETAVDTPTLEVLAAHGIRFTILAPGQADSVRPLGDGPWASVGDAGVDTRRPYLVRLPSGREISVFFYDGARSQSVAFDRLLCDGSGFARRLLDGFDDRAEPQLVHIATDGETYGHHHRHGEMALAYALEQIESEGLARVTNYGELLAMCPPTHEARIREESSWSCVHGVERWRSDCGCGGGPDGWNQRWRRPLREALEWLSTQVADVFERRGGDVLDDPWGARDRYIEVVLDREEGRVDRFLEREGVRPDRREQALQLLEMQRQGLLMFTSCGWFFEDVARIEGVQILRYACRAIQVARDAAEVDLSEEFSTRLEAAHSNEPGRGSARSVYEAEVESTRVEHARVVAHHAVGALFGSAEHSDTLRAFRVEDLARTSRTAGRATLVVGQAKVTSTITRETETSSYAVLHLGDHDLSVGVRRSRGPEAYRALTEEILAPFDRGDLQSTLQASSRLLSEHSFTLASLLPDEQARFMERVLKRAVEDVEASAGALHRQYGSMTRHAASLDHPIPRALRGNLGLVIDAELRELLGADRIDLAQVDALVREAKAVGVELDLAGLGAALTEAQVSLLAGWRGSPADLAGLERLCEVARLSRRLELPVERFAAQNALFEAVQEAKVPESELDWSRREDEDRWWTLAEELGELLEVRVRRA